MSLPRVGIHIAASAFHPRADENGIRREHNPIPAVSAADFTTVVEKTDPGGESPPPGRCRLAVLSADLYFGPIFVTLA
jgi:hypothetical protein